MPIIGILSIISAVVLSIISAIFSITGIRTIFSGALWGVTIMGASMELAKISATLWLYSTWKKSKNLIKVYFFIAIIILIIISTIGIFGYLSKAYVGQRVVAIRYDNEIERLENLIKRERREIDRAQKDINLLDDALQSYIDLNVITIALKKREEQESERIELRNRIKQAEDNIAQYQDQIYKLKNEKESYEVNVGPVKYIAMIIYGEKNAQDFYDNAARVLIILLCVVFDPFAVLLMVAGNVSIEFYNSDKRKNKGIKKKSKKDEKRVKLKPAALAEPKREKIESSPIIKNEESTVEKEIVREIEKDYVGDVPGRIEKKIRRRLKK